MHFSPSLKFSMKAPILCTLLTRDCVSFMDAEFSWYVKHSLSLSWTSWCTELGNPCKMLGSKWHFFKFMGHSYKIVTYWKLVTSSKKWMDNNDNKFLIRVHVCHYPSMFSESGRTNKEYKFWYVGPGWSLALYNKAYNLIISRYCSSHSCDYQLSFELPSFTCEHLGKTECSEME